jgi:hypothetical protein
MQAFATNSKFQMPKSLPALYHVRLRACARLRQARQAEKVQDFEFAMNHIRFMIGPEPHVVRETLTFGID